MLQRVSEEHRYWDIGAHLLFQIRQCLLHLSMLDLECLDELVG